MHLIMMVLTINALTSCLSAHHILEINTMQPHGLAADQVG